MLNRTLGHGWIGGGHHTDGPVFSGLDGFIVPCKSKLQCTIKCTQEVGSRLARAPPLGVFFGHVHLPGSCRLTQDTKWRPQVRGSRSACAAQLHGYLGMQTWVVERTIHAPTPLERHAVIQRIFLFCIPHILIPTGLAGGGS